MRSFAIALFAVATAATEIDNWNQGQSYQPWNQQKQQSWGKPAQPSYKPAQPQHKPWDTKPAQPQHKPWDTKPQLKPWDTKPAQPSYNSWNTKPALPSYGQPQKSHHQSIGYQAGSNQHQQHNHQQQPHQQQHHQQQHHQQQHHQQQHQQQHHSNPYQHAHNPYQPWNVQKPEGWWSAHQQYSPPKIAYVPAQLYKPAYSVCEFDSDAMDNYVLKIGQMPGHPAAIMGTLTPVSTSGNTGSNLTFTLREYGDIGDDADGNICANGGDVFNPLAEIIYGVNNPYADPSRGTINDQALTDPTDVSATTLTWTQAKFMQNLAGKNSIIGKSIVVTRSDPSDPTMIDTIGCCVIGQAAAPVLANNNANGAYTHQHQHAPVHNHGAHGGHQVGYGSPIKPQFGQYGGYQAPKPQQHGHSNHGHSHSHQNQNHHGNHGSHAGYGRY